MASCLSWGGMGGSSRLPLLLEKHHALSSRCKAAAGEGRKNCVREKKRRGNRESEEKSFHRSRLHSAMEVLLTVPSIKEVRRLSPRSRAFLVLAPLLWNSLSLESYLAPSLLTHRKLVKTRSGARSHSPNSTHSQLRGAAWCAVRMTGN